MQITEEMPECTHSVTPTMPEISWSPPTEREGTTLRLQAGGGGSWSLHHQVGVVALQTGDRPSHARQSGELGDVGCCLWPVPRPACCIL